MQDTHVNMQDTHVNMQDKYVNMAINTSLEAWTCLQVPCIF